MTKPGNLTRTVSFRLRKLLKKDRFRDALIHHLARTRTNCVLDVGANTGQYGEHLRKNCNFSGYIHSFEPVRASFDLLTKRAANDPKWFVHQHAFGEIEGSFDINVGPRSDFNSFKGTTDFGQHGFDRNGIEFLGTERVRVERLDSFLSSPPRVLGGAALFFEDRHAGF